MATPKKRTSVSRKGLRRGGHTHKLSPILTRTCPTTGERTLPHRISPNGIYKGVKIFETRADRIAKKEAEQGQAAE